MNLAENRVHGGGDTSYLTDGLLLAYACNEATIMKNDNMVIFKK